MGKRELLLIAVFIVLGVLLYQVTAPATQPGQRRLSVSGIIDKIRREVRGNRANAEVVSTATHPVSPSASELRIAITSGQITVTGEDRNDIASELKVRSTGYDDAEAQSLARKTVLKLDSTAGSIVTKVDVPPRGSQRLTLVLRVPSSLRVRLEPVVGRLEITNVASAEVMGARGETIIKGVKDRVSLTHRGGDLTIENVGSLRLSSRGSDVKLSRVRGEATLQLQAGDLRADSITGPLEIESTGSELTLEKLAEMKGVLRVNATSGRVTVRDLQSEARVDGRGAEIDVRLEKPVPISIYNSGEDIEITPPPGGYDLDAVATIGRITIPQSLQSEVSLAGTESDKEQRASGKVKGGGPAITVRATRGDVRVNARESTADQR